MKFKCYLVAFVIALAGCRSYSETTQTCRESLQMEQLRKQVTELQTAVTSSRDLQIRVDHFGAPDTMGVQHLESSKAITVKDEIQTIGSETKNVADTTRMGAQGTQEGTQENEKAKHPPDSCIPYWMLAAALLFALIGLFTKK